jgi:hypothetical protein
LINSTFSVSSTVTKNNTNTTSLFTENTTTHRDCIIKCQVYWKNYCFGSKAWPKRGNYSSLHTARLLRKKMLNGSNQVSSEADKGSDVHVTFGESHVIQGLQHLLESVRGRRLHRFDRLRNWSGGRRGCRRRSGCNRSRSDGNSRSNFRNDGSRGSRKRGAGRGCHDVGSGSRLGLLSADFQERVVGMNFLVKAGLTKVEVRAVCEGGCERLRNRPVKHGKLRTKALEALTNDGVGIASIADYVAVNILAFIVLHNVVLETLPPRTAASRASAVAGIATVTAFAALLPPRATTPLTTRGAVVCRNVRVLMLLVPGVAWRARGRQFGLSGNPKTEDRSCQLGQTNGLKQFLIGSDLRE